MLEHGLVLMIIGMSTVLAFLTTMVFIIILSSKIINKYIGNKNERKTK